MQLFRINFSSCMRSVWRIKSLCPLSAANGANCAALSAIGIGGCVRDTGRDKCIISSYGFVVWLFFVFLLCIYALFSMLYDRQSVDYDPVP